ncbi:hypothetical protein Neosp_009508 [[Neocosmospora] mangrovei]
MVRWFVKAHRKTLPSRLLADSASDAERDIQLPILNEASMCKMSNQSAYRVAQRVAMPQKSAKGKEREVDHDLTETDPDLTETDPDLTQSDSDMIDRDDYAADNEQRSSGPVDLLRAAMLLNDEQQVGPSRVYYCSKCGDYLDGRVGPLCLNCLRSESQESWKAHNKRLLNNESYKRAKDAELCCYCRERQADPGHSSCAPCRQKRKEQVADSRKKKKGEKVEEKRKSKEEKKTEEKSKKKSKDKSKDKTKNKK